MLLTLFGLSKALSANQTIEHTRKLEQIRAQILSIAQTLEKEQQQRDKLQSELRNSEKQLAQLNHDRRRLDGKIRGHQHELGELQQQKSSLRKSLDKHRERLAGQIVSAYKIGHQEQIKLLLNQAKPDALNRVLSYYRYFNQARTRLIEEVHDKLSALITVETAIQKQLTEVQVLNTDKQRLAVTLDSKLQQRKQLLADINREIEQHGQLIERLKADELRIQRLLQKLNNVFADIPDNLQARPFHSLKGHLQWPTTGRLLHRYGERRGNSDLRWQGLAIAAPNGQTVQAISHGRVAFADWLQGFGLLLIIDHQDGYMSLYAHNQSLFKETGDWVNQGDSIASVGNSGGLADSRLYVEIRHQGLPLNPELWFVPRG